MSMRDRMRELGYSEEDKYFFKKDQELIAKMREAADRRKKELEAEHKGQSYWMTCPKCGTGLEEESLGGVVRVDRCSGCGGTYFDQGELDLWLKSRLGSATEKEE